MLSSSGRGQLIAFGIVLVTLIPLYYFASPTHQRVRDLFSLRQELTRDRFVDLALSHQVSDPWNTSAIKAICHKNKPSPGLVVQCAPGTGGVGNIRSYMLHCTRFAMEAGASMVVPRFHRRGRSDLFELNGELADFEHFFDKAHFKSSIQQMCPHMVVHDEVDRQAGAWAENVTAELGIPGFAGSISNSKTTNSISWRDEFGAWLEKKTKDAVGRPVLLTSGDPGRGRAVLDDGFEFYYAFGRILDFRPDVRRLAAVALHALSQRSVLHFDPSENIMAGTYMGAHIRTSKDAVKAGWPVDFEQQTDWYLNQTRSANLSVVYAAGGNDLDLDRFARKAASEGIECVTKYDLLSGNDMKELENLVWDQKALLDFEILLRSAQYGGFARSSFAHNVAFRRHYNSKVDWETSFGDPNDHFADELSRVYGRYDGGWEDETVRTMWP